jgi:DNA-binding CsgD family transcriptional regulator
MSDQPLRPLERRILRQVAAGDDVGEIGRRFRRSPEFVQRVIGFTDIERGASAPADTEILRPVERRVLRLRADGVGYDDLGARFRRSPAHVERIEQLAHVKLAKRG